MRKQRPQRAPTNLKQGYLIQQLVAQWMPHLQPNHQRTIGCLVFALLALGTLAQSQVSVWLALWTATQPNTWRQRLKRLRQQPFPETACFQALLRAALALLRPPEVFLALDATTLRQQHTVLVISLVCHQTAIPVAWRVIPAQQRGSWRPAWEALLQAVQTVIPRTVPVYVLADRGLWAQWLFRAIRQCGWHPLMRINAQGQFRARWQRQALPLAAFVPTRGQQVVVEGFAFRYGLRCTLVVYWGASAQEPWYLLTDLPASAVDGAWYGLRSWIEQGFRQWKRGGWAWHRTRVVDSRRVFVSWLVYALAQLVVLVLGVWAQERLRLWDSRRRSLGVYRLGRLVVQVWLLGLLAWDVGKRLGLEAGGELK